MKTDLLFTFVPERSLQAFSRGRIPTLRELLCALIVDPLEAEDAAEQLDPLEISCTLTDFADRGAAMYRASLETIAQWVIMKSRIGEMFSAMDAIGRYDARLGTWCSFCVCQEMLARDAECAPMLEQLRRWILGEIDSEALRRIVDEIRVPSAAYELRFRLLSKVMSSAIGRFSHSLFLNSASRLLAQRITDVTDGGRSGLEAQQEALLVIGEDVSKACLSFPLKP